MVDRDAEILSELKAIRSRLDWLLLVLLLPIFIGIGVALYAAITGGL